MILGRNEQDIAPVMQQLANTAEWQVNAFEHKEDAVNHFVAGDLDVIIFTKAVEDGIKSGLAKLFSFRQNDLILLADADEKDIWHKVNEALHQLADSKRPRYAFVDDALKHARFNINLN